MRNKGESREGKGHTRLAAPEEHKRGATVGREGNSFKQIHILVHKQVFSFIPPIEKGFLLEQRM